MPKNHDIKIDTDNKPYTLVMLDVNDVLITNTDPPEFNDAAIDIFAEMAKNDPNLKFCIASHMSLKELQANKFNNNQLNRSRRHEELAEVLQGRGIPIAFDTRNDDWHDAWIMKYQTELEQGLFRKEDVSDDKLFMKYLYGELEAQQILPTEFIFYSNRPQREVFTDEMIKDIGKNFKLHMMDVTGLKNPKSSKHLHPIFRQEQGIPLKPIPGQTQPMDPALGSSPQAQPIKDMVEEEQRKYVDIKRSMNMNLEKNQTPFLQPPVGKQCEEECRNASKTLGLLHSKSDKFNPSAFYSPREIEKAVQTIKELAGYGNSLALLSLAKLAVRGTEVPEDKQGAYYLACLAYVNCTTADEKQGIETFLRTHFENDLRGRNITPTENGNRIQIGDAFPYDIWFSQKGFLDRTKVEPIKPGGSDAKQIRLAQLKEQKAELESIRFSPPSSASHVPRH